MIVRAHDGDLILVRQLDHAALSGACTHHWGNGRFARAQPLAPLVLASSRHDEGWREPDERPLYDEATKRPVNFRQIEVHQHLPLYGEGVVRIVALDPYAGLLVSMHASGIYQRRYGAGPIRMTTQTAEVQSLMQVFVAEQEALQAELKRRLWQPPERRSIFERRVWTHYEWLQVWDLLSLFVCTHDLTQAAAERIEAVPVAEGGPDVAITIRAEGDGVVSLDPYPFDTPGWTATVPARAVPDRPYASVDDLRAALATARDATISVRFGPAGGARVEA